MRSRGSYGSIVSIALPRLALCVTFPADLFSTTSLIFPHHALLLHHMTPTLSLWLGEFWVTWVIRLIETQHPGTQLPKAFALFLIMPQQENNIHTDSVSLLPQSEQIPCEEHCMLAAISLLIIPLQPEDRQDQLQPSHLTMPHCHCFSFSLTRIVQPSCKCEASPH